MHRLLESLVRRYPDLNVCVADIQRAVVLLETSFRQGGKLLVCGNGEARLTASTWSAS